MTTLLQLPDATNAVKEIGFAPTVMLIILLGLVAVFGIVVRWFMRKIDEKDVAYIQEVKDRREDLAKVEAAMRETAKALEQGTNNMRSAFDNLAQEVRRK